MTDYTEPNIKSKGSLEPRRAVIPMDEETFERITAAKAKEKGLERIQLLDEDSSIPDAAPKDEGKGKKDSTVQRKPSVKKSKKAEPTATEGKSVGRRTPKHEFRIIKSEDDNKRSSFVMTILLPDEVGICR